jgi:hypothetical protein
MLIAANREVLLGKEDLPKSATTPCPNYEREAYDILQNKMSAIAGLKQRVYERSSSSTGQQQQSAQQKHHDQDRRQPPLLVGLQELHKFTKEGRIALRIGDLRKIIGGFSFCHNIYSNSLI